MKITGIIAEYNPFHNGHLYQIEQIKKNGADYVVIVMSGNFLQRGTPAILDKWTRTQMALSSGADLVIELPAVFATASAQYFARGGVSILDKLGCIDTISFGCESDDIDTIRELSSILWKEPDFYKEKLQTYLKEGNSFPKARESALAFYLNNTNTSVSYSSSEAAAFASSPNNILALEYCIALLERGSTMNILPIKREGSGYHETELESEVFPSATAIRKILESDLANTAISPNPYIAKHGDSPTTKYKDAFTEISYSALPLLNSYVPKVVAPLITTNSSKFVWQDDFSLLLKYKLLSQGNASLEGYADVSKELSDKIHKNLRYYQNYTQFCELLKSKELTYSRINRALTHILLDITQDMYDDIKASDYASYARILGFRKDAKQLLSEIGKHTSIPLISKLADASDILDDKAMRYLEHDIFCSHVYEAVIAHKLSAESKNEFQRQLILY